MTPRANLLREVALVVAAALVATAATAEISPNGPEFLINSYTPSSQYAPDVASDSAGNFVVVWQSNGSTGGDTWYSSIQVRRFRADGTPLGTDLQVNTYTTQAQTEPAVAMDGAGNFIVVWRSDTATGDPDLSSIHARRFAADGTPFGGQFQVNTYTTGYQEFPDVAADAAGNFLIVWASSAAGNGDSSGASVQAQRYAASGAAQGAQFLVNVSTTGNQRRPAVAADGLGNFLVAWQSDSSAGGDTLLSSVQGRRFTGSGSALGGEFQINGYTTGTQNVPAIGAAASGAFVATWESNGSPGGDSDGLSVHARRYDSSGTALGAQAQINEYTTNWQRLADVAVDANGGFVVTWESFAAAGDTSSRSVHARRFSADGTPREGQFQVNSYTTNYQDQPAIASDARGNFVVVWQSLGAASGDTSYQSIWARRYDALFRDGFASGDLQRWSASAP